MKLKFTRGRLLVLGFLLFVVCYFLQRTRAFRQSEFVVGVVVNDEQNEPTFTGEIMMNLYYFVGADEYCVPTYQYPEKENSIVTVRYKASSPEKGDIYTRGEFWLLNMLWLILPMMLWTAFVLSFIEERDKVEFEVSRRESCKNKLNNSSSNHVVSDSDSVRGE